MVERTLVLVKPDAVKRQLTGRIVERFENAGLKIVGMKMIWVDDNFAKKHYREDDIAKRHGETVWKNLLKFIVEGPVVAFVLEGNDVIEVVRKICGPTEPKSAQPGTIRGDFAHHSYSSADAGQKAIRNVVHSSANKDDAKLEIVLWFLEKELHTYKSVQDFCMY